LCADQKDKLKFEVEKNYCYLHVLISTVFCEPVNQPVYKNVYFE